MKLHSYYNIRISLLNENCSKRKFLLLFFIYYMLVFIRKCFIESYVVWLFFCLFHNNLSSLHFSVPVLDLNTVMYCTFRGIVIYLKPISFVKVSIQILIIRYYYYRDRNYIYLYRDKYDKNMLS